MSPRHCSQRVLELPRALLPHPEMFPGAPLPNKGTSAHHSLCYLQGGGNGDSSQCSAPALSLGPALLSHFFILQPWDGSLLMPTSSWGN